MIEAAFAEREAQTAGPARPEGARPVDGAARTILVDGFNVLHALLSAEERGDGWWRRAERERLLARAARWPDRADQVWVAFDGAEPAWSVWTEPVAKPVDLEAADRAGRHPIHSVFVESADDWIVRRARRAVRPERTVVVTRDRQVAGRARSAGCEVWAPGDFMARCASAEST